MDKKNLCWFCTVRLIFTHKIVRIYFTFITLSITIENLPSTDSEVSAIQGIWIRNSWMWPFWIMNGRPRRDSMMSIIISRLFHSASIYKRKLMKHCLNYILIHSHVYYFQFFYFLASHFLFQNFTRITVCPVCRIKQALQ